MIFYTAVGYVPREFNYNPSDNPYCQCVSGGSHCLQSREDQNFAQHEGWANYFASRVFNRHTSPNGTYVSNALFYDGSTVYPPDPHDIYHPVRWHLENCPALHSGVEWDWTAFFYRVSNHYNESRRISVYDLMRVYRYSCTGSDMGRCTSANFVGTWASLNIAAYYVLDDEKYERFWEKLNDFGLVMAW